MVNIDCCHLALVFTIISFAQFFFFFLIIHLIWDMIILNYFSAAITLKKCIIKNSGLKLQIRDIFQVIIRNTNFSEAFYIGALYIRSQKLIFCRLWTCLLNCTPTQTYDFNFPNFNCLLLNLLNLATKHIL